MLIYTEEKKFTKKQVQSTVLNLWKTVQPYRFVTTVTCINEAEYGKR